MEEDLVHEDSDELVFLRVNGNSFEFKSGNDICPLKDGYVEPLNSGTTFTRLNLSWMLLNMAINYRFFKFLRLSQLKTIVRLWSNQLSSKVPSTISLATVASLKCLKLLLSSIICP